MAETVNLSTSTRPAVLAAIKEFDDVGQEAFLRRRGYAEARNFRLVYRGRVTTRKPSRELRTGTPRVALSTAVNSRVGWQQSRIA